METHLKHNNKLARIKRNKVIAGITIITLLVIIWAVNKNSKIRLESAISEHAYLLEKEAQAKSELSNLYEKYSECFDPQSTDISSFCLEGLPKIKNTLSKERDVLLSVGYFYENRKDDLDSESRTFIENNVKLISSTEFQDVYMATADLLDAYIDFYLFLEDEIDTSEINEETTEDEKINILAEGIANRNIRRELVLKNITDLSETLDLKEEMLKRYIEANFSDDFIKLLGE